MSRKTKTITIQGKREDIPGKRDNEKVFVITEMSAYDAEMWANRSFLALANAGIDLPPGITQDSGMPALVQVAMLLGHVRFPDLRPLMDELLDCVQFQPDPKQPGFTLALTRGQGVNDTIEDVSTYQLLRQEVAALHVNFTLAATVLILIARATSLPAISLTPSEDTGTSPAPSAQ